MRNYRWILFTTCSVFLLTWLPHLLCGLVKAGAGLVELSLVSLTSGLLTTPIVHPGQVRSLPSSASCLEIIFRTRSSSRS